MTKRFKLVKCIENHWGLVDTLLDDTDQLVLIHTSKSSVNYLVRLLNRFNEENEQLKDFIEHYEQWFRNEEIREIMVGDCKVVLNDQKKI